MLPAPPATAGSLTEVVPSLSAAMLGRPGPLGLPRVRSAVLVLVDGLGESSLGAAAAHARFLAPRPRRTATTVFPTTTVAALTSLTTGVLPGRHGILGYRVLDAANDRLLNLINGWDDRADPLRWQRQPTLFETAPHRVVMVAAPRYRDTGFSRAAFRGAEFVSGRTPADRLQAVLGVLREGPALIYCYLPELDQAAHAHGWRSKEWTAALDELDALLRGFELRLPGGVGVLVTADHGIVDVPMSGHRELDAVPGILAGVRHLGGEPRGVQLWLEPSAPAGAADALAARLGEALGDEAWVRTRRQLVEEGPLAGLDPDLAGRFGEVAVIARGELAFYHAAAEPASRGMIGQHGGLSVDERVVPLIGLGDFAQGG